MADELIKPDDLLSQIDHRPSATGWMDTPVDMRPGSYIYPAKPKHLEYFGLPNPRQWSPLDEDWKLPENWQQIIHEVRIAVRALDDGIAAVEAGADVVHGTALGVVRSAVAAGKRISVIADETRPFLQGARLTAWELQADDVTFWTAWDEQELLGCGAMKELDARHGEIKSMRTARKHLGKGVAAELLRHIMAVAHDRGYGRLSLETGSGPAFEPAHALYQKFGFEFCGPFHEYGPDLSSRFMTRRLSQRLGRRER